MKGLLKSKLVLSLAALVMIAAAVVIPLSGSISGSHAQSTLVTFAKSATPTVAPGGTINYTLTLTNITPSGSGTLHDIHLSDTPPAQTSGTFTAPTFTITPPGSATVDCALSTATSIACAVDDFAPGSVVTVSFSTTASSTATGTITDTATATTFSGNINETATANTVVTAPGITITHACPSQQTIAGPFTGVQAVTGSVTLSSSDPKEASQGENLVLQETNSLFTKTIMTVAVNTGSHALKFISSVVKGERLTACIQHHDSDEVGTVNQTTSPPLSFHLNLDTLKTFLIKHGLLNPISLLTLGLDFAHNTLHFKDCAEAIGNPLLTIAGKLAKCAGLILGVLHFGAPDPVLKEFFRLLGVGVDATFCITGIGASGVTLGASIVLCIPMTIDIILELLHPGGQG